MTMEKTIQALFASAGFPWVGFVGEEDCHFGPWYAEWLSRGYQAGMDWMARNLHLRADPLLIHPGARAVILVAVPYKTTPPEGDLGANRWISRYAWGEDYHGWTKKRLQALLPELGQRFAGFEGRVFVDSAPLPEKRLAHQAGLGFIGKNSLLVHPQLGSYLFLAEVLCNLPLKTTGPLVSEGCGSCNACLEACPNSAIKPRGMVDANWCISYLTIEHIGPFTPVQAKATRGSLFGCDRCQEGCPYNQKAPDQVGGPFAFDPRWAGLEPAKVLEWSEPKFEALKVKSPIKRAGLEGWVRNAKAALGEQDP